MESLESQRRREAKARQQRIEEQKTDAWYVTLLGSTLGWGSPLTRVARERARRRNEEVTSPPGA